MKTLQTSAKCKGKEGKSCYWRRLGPSRFCFDAKFIEVRKLCVPTCTDVRKLSIKKHVQYPDINQCGDDN